MKKQTCLLLAACAVVSACSEIPAGAYYNRGEPENLLDTSTEVVTLSLSRGSMEALASMVAEDPPSRVELACAAADPLCAEAMDIFDRQAIPTEFAGAGGEVTLVYERVMPRDCENRYIDNSINPYNLHPLTFGCSVSANTVQMVSDKRQFVSPALMDFPDGEKPVQAYRHYLKPADSGKKSSPSLFIPSLRAN